MPAKKLVPTPSQTVGPFYHLGLDRPGWADLTADDPAGERVTITGRITDGDGAAVPDAFLEVWQANAAGRYDHPDDDRGEIAVDPRFRGFARVLPDADGRFTLKTIRPGPVPGNGNALQAPHINVAVFGRGLLRQLFTRIYFSDEPGNSDDPVLLSIADRTVRDTLIARRQSPTGTTPATYRFDIVLQGAGETAFFDI